MTNKKDESIDNNRDSNHDSNHANCHNTLAYRIRAKKDELSEILERQDDHVRLLFQLEKFVSLVYYDPKEAKQDHSNVFEEFRQPYDLWSKVSDEKHGGTTRSTRRQIRHQRHVIEKPEKKAVSTQVTENKVSKTPDSKKSHSGKHLRMEKNTLQRSKQSKSKSRAVRTQSKSKGKKVREIVSESESKSESDIGEFSGLDFDIDSSELETPDEDTVIPRLKLKVSVPRQTITHPSHVPKVDSETLRSAEPIHSYLSSFISLDDDISEEQRQAFIQNQIDVRNRIDEARRRGLLTESFETTSRKQPAFGDPVKVNFATQHDHLVSHAVYFAKLMSDERKQHMATARKVANMIDMYFKRLSGAEERERKIQEKLIRQLARRTANEVLKKWKLAEKVVMQRKTQELEEQQRARGKIQLNNILEHSAQLLEARRQFHDDSDDESDESINEDESMADGDADSNDMSDSDLESESSGDSEVMSSSDESEDEKADVEVDQGDELLTVEELKAKYAKLSEIEIEETGTKPENGEANLSVLYANGKISDPEENSTSDESITMDSEEEGSEEQDDSEDEGDQSVEPARTLSSLFGAEIHDSDSDQSVKSIVSSKSSVKDSPTPVSSPEIHKIASPFLLRGTLREYQHDGLDWLAGLYNNSTNGILADEMGLGKTIQTIALLSYLACEKEIWGPHLIVVPTSVMLNWEMEFKRFAPGFKVMTYYGNPQQRKEKRRGWNKEDTWHVCITSYQLVLQDHNAFRRKRWHYLILDEAHNIKNFRSQRWQALLNFNSERRLLLTGTPLQNNLIELWSLLYFLMPSSKQTVMPEGFANLKDFQEWFARPVDRLVEGGAQADDETRQTVSKLHQVLRPYLLRRLKADVEKQMPAKYEHIVYCRLSKRQRYLYDDFMSRAQTRETLASGNFLSIINCLMQLRKVCNHPDLFEVRPIVTSLALNKSVASNFQDNARVIEKLLHKGDQDRIVNLSTLSLLINDVSMTTQNYMTLRRIRGTKSLARELSLLAVISPPVKPDFESIEKHARYKQYLDRYSLAEKLQHQIYINAFRCSRKPLYFQNVIDAVSLTPRPTKGFDWSDLRVMKTLKLSPRARELKMGEVIDKYSFVTPKITCLDMPQLVLGEKVVNNEEIEVLRRQELFHQSQVKLTIAFPDKRLLQYDCGKLQRLAVLLRDLVSEGHRALIFTQMTKVLDILEQFLNIHGLRYLRLDGATKIEQRQALTEQFNADNRISVFILSTRSGGLGINLTGADTVIFYDSDWNPSMDKQCQDRCHRIGQTRDVHIYRFVSEYTIESNILKKATQKTILDNVVIQEGDFTTDYFNKITVKDMIGDVVPDANISDNTLGSKSFEKALKQAEDADDVAAASVALKEANVDRDDFVEGYVGNANREISVSSAGRESSRASRAESLVPGGSAVSESETIEPSAEPEEDRAGEEDDNEEEDEEVGSVDDYMIRFIEQGYFEN